MQTKWSGCFTALVTPFEGTGLNPPVDFAAVRTLVEAQKDAGITGIVPCGTTGESPTLTHDEKIKLIECCVDNAGSSMLVMAGTGGNCTRDAVALTEHAQDVGAHAILQVCPYYNKPNQQGLFEHFSAIASATSLPIFLYNVPTRTARDIAPETMARLSKEHSNIIGVKEASGNSSTWAQVRELTGEKFIMLSGNDSDTYSMMKDFGASGIISVASNLFPKTLVKFTELGTTRNFNLMKDENEMLSPFFESLFIDSNPIMVKEGMNYLGLPAGGFRLPMCKSSEEKRRTLIDVMLRLGLKG